MSEVKATVIDGIKCITTGQLGDVFAVKLPIDFVRDVLGINPYCRDRATWFWRVDDLASIAARWKDHIDRRLAGAPKP